MESRKLNRRAEKAPVSKGEFGNFIKLNVKKIVGIFFVYFIPLFTIGLVNFPFIDDVDRQLRGYTGFGFTYSRWGSEIIAKLFQGSSHLVDMGIFSYILSAIFLTIISIIVVITLNGKLTWVSLLASTFIGLNPWFLECILFRFDNPYMVLSVLFSVLPFLFFDRRGLFSVVSIFSVFMMCNTYQSSSGIYIVMVLAISLRYVISGFKFQNIMRNAIVSAISYSFGILLYYLQLKFLPGTFSSTSVEGLGVSSLTDLPYAVIHNFSEYITMFQEKSSFIWIFLSQIILISFVIFFFLISKSSFFVNIVSIISYYVFGIILCSGVYIFYSDNILNRTPRYGYGLPIFITITLVMLTTRVDFIWLNRYTKLVTFISFFYLFSFPFTLSTALSYQKDSFEIQSSVLYSDLNPLITSNRSVIHVNKLFKNSVVRDSSSQNYPILVYLVPGNDLVSWTNLLWFKNLINLGDNIVIDSYNPVDKDLGTLHLEKETYSYKIYTNEKEIFVQMNY